MRFFVAPKVHELIVNMQKEYDEMGTPSPSRLLVVQEPGVCSTLTALAPRAATADLSGMGLDRPQAQRLLMTGLEMRVM